jgi:hypothetical protein
MCAESVDLPGGRHVDGVRVDPSVPPRDAGDAVVVTGRLVEPVDRPWPYDSGGRDDPGESDEEPEADVDVPLVPYHTWANRGPSTMRVWLPTT